MKFDEEMGEPGTKTYRFNSWAKRHPVLVVLVIAFLIAGGLFLRFLRYSS